MKRFFIKILSVSNRLTRITADFSFSLFSVFLLISISTDAQTIQRSSVLSNSGHVIQEPSGTSKIIGTLGQPFIGVISGANDQINQGFVATVSPEFLVDISVLIVSTPVQGISIGGTHPGFTNYLVGFDQPTEITLIAPETFGASQFVTWVIDDTDVSSLTTLSLTVTQDAEIIAVYETLLLIDPNWNLLSLPVAPDQETINSIIATTTSPIWLWDGARFEVSSLFGAGMGFWLNSTMSVDLRPQGDPPLSMEIPLNPGWNLVGVKDQQFIHQSELTNTQENIWFWDSTNQKMISVDDPTLPSFEQGRLFPGRGYWIYGR